MITTRMLFIIGLVTSSLFVVSYATDFITPEENVADNAKAIDISLNTVKQRFTNNHFDLKIRNHYLRNKRIEEHLQNAMFYRDKGLDRYKRQSLALAQSIIVHHEQQVAQPRNAI